MVRKWYVRRYNVNNLSTYQSVWGATFFSSSSLFFRTEPKYENRIVSKHYAASLMREPKYENRIVSEHYAASLMRYSPRKKFIIQLDTDDEIYIYDEVGKSMR